MDWRAGFPRCAAIVRAGLRPDGVFLGERDHLGDPLPEFIGARAQDLGDLMAGHDDLREHLVIKDKVIGISLVVDLLQYLPGKGPVAGMVFRELLPYHDVLE